MDRAKMEIAAVEETMKDASDAALSELDELQLVLVGGGSADPIYH